MPRVSIIMPVYNAAPFLGQALDSIAGQSFRDFEILVYDDGSTDASAGILDARAFKDKRIRITGSKRAGLVNALRSCVSESDSEFLARMDADDVSHTERISRQLQLFSEDVDTALAGCLVDMIPEDAVTGGMGRYVQWLNSIVTPDDFRRSMFIESPMCHPSVMMRRSAYEKCGGYVDDGNPEDYGLWLRFFEHGFKMAKVPEVLFFWREHENRLTRTDPRYGKDRFFELKFLHVLKGPLVNRKSVTICGAGMNGKMWARALIKAGVEIAAFVDVDPGRVGKTIHGARVIGPEELKNGIPSGFMLAAVAQPGGREQIRSLMYELGYSDPEDFICVA